MATAIFYGTTPRRLSVGAREEIISQRDYIWKDSVFQKEYRIRGTNLGNTRGMEHSMKDRYSFRRREDCCLQHQSKGRWKGNNHSGYSRN